MARKMGQTFKPIDGWAAGGNRQHTASTIVNINPFTVVEADAITISLSDRPLEVPKEIPLEMLSQT